MSQIVIISGPPGSGKSAVAESLAERYDRTVHLETDVLYDAIRMGATKPWRTGSDRQNRMVTRAAARAAVAYAQEMFAVFVDGVVGPHLLPIYIEELRPAVVPVHFVLLLPSLDDVLHRGLTREARPRVPEPQLRRLYEEFRAYGDFAGCTIDNTGLTADQTGDLVMEACGEGRCLVHRPD